MMRRCLLLIAFLFCIDRVAWLEAVGVHNWPFIFNNNPSKNWVVLVAGTNNWDNYRHQLMAMELNDTLAYMHSKRKFNKLVLYVEACYSGSMFKDVLPSNLGRRIPVGKFQGHYDLLMHRNDGAIVPNAVDGKPYCQAHLFSKSRRLMSAATEEEHETAWRKLHRALQLGHIVKETCRDIVLDVTTHHKPTPKGLSKRDELMFFKADVYHAYQVMRKNNVPARNIITLAYDDIANNPKNPFREEVFHEYLRDDVYNGVIIDYRGKDVTRDNFVKVLKGDEKLEANKKKVLKSGPNDNVFIFYSGHGGTRFIGFLHETLRAMELNDTLAYMHSNKMFNKLVLYMESCSSGSMFKDILPSNMGIYVTTSTTEDEQSHAIFCLDEDIDVCLANEYSLRWILDSEYKDLKKRTLEEQYEEVKKTTKLSHVMKYGEMAMGSLPVGKFHGHYDLLMHRKDGAIAPNAEDRKPYCQANLISKFRRLMAAATEEEHVTAWPKLHRALQLANIVKDTFRDFVERVKTNHKPTVKGLSKRDELMCFKAVFDQFRTHCFTIQQAS
ncbi:hypothetical protein T265_12058 [Opisthorchis viverrini]|uniref:Peptidase C13 family protein n=1 Tax=Opisthorchis viverrini TaxID=6198 RepID=A0A074YW56_OPIVI|nr:hypothetical protein T265_12058 [Opisthorchis viverrini]KER19006.1 hypothetical protein T265_12058 [Opisthorchis viverrini]